MFLLSDSDDEKQASRDASDRNDRNGKSKGAAPNPEFWSKVSQDEPKFPKLSRNQFINLRVRMTIVAIDSTIPD